MNIVIIDYGMGNPGSTLNMLKYLGIEAIISGDIHEINNAKKIILPGVGSFDNGISNLKASGIFDILSEKVLKNKTPILGICLGMQLMTLRSEEGSSAGFGWINASTVKFSFNNSQLKVPHTGWDKLLVEQQNPITEGLNEGSKFYFVHSYYVVCHDKNDSICKTSYGIDFDSMFAKDHIFGCQFHPEKSHRHGMQIFKNFNNL